MISLRARLVRFVTRQVFKRIHPDDDVEMHRLAFEAVGIRARRPQGMQIRLERIAGVECEWLIPHGHEDAPVLMYLHGGAYLMGSANSHRVLISSIAKAANVRAVSPNYRLAPEHPFPAALDDATAVYRELIGGGIDPASLCIAGDSAGGGLTMACLVKLRDSAEPLPGAAVLISPWLDLAGEGDSMVTRSHKDPWFRPEDLRAVARKYRPDGDLKDPLVSPLYADPAGLPPLLIQVGDHEILLSDSTRLADRISATSGPVTLQVWPHMWHVFQYFVGRMPESALAIQQIGAFMRAHSHSARETA